MRKKWKNGKPGDMKCYIITLSKTFLKGHRREGEPTGFKQAYLSGVKKHTLRTNIEYWGKIIDEVNAGEAYLSVRQWSGKPYASKQDSEIGRHYKLGKELFEIDPAGVFDIEGKYLPMYGEEHLSFNDGLHPVDFYSWFNKYPLQGIIIHFTDLKYSVEWKEKLEVEPINF